MRPRNVVQLRMRHKPKMPTHAEVVARLRYARITLTRHIDPSLADEMSRVLADLRYDLTRIEQYLTGEV